MEENAEESYDREVRRVGTGTLNNRAACAGSLRANAFMLSAEPYLQHCYNFSIPDTTTVKGKQTAVVSVGSSLHDGLCPRGIELNGVLECLQRLQKKASGEEQFVDGMLRSKPPRDKSAPLLQRSGVRSRSLSPQMRARRRSCRDFAWHAL